MKISNIWKNSGTTEENKGYRVSAELNNDNYTRNKKLDMSCAYGLSRGKYSPVCNISNVVLCADSEVLNNQILNVNVLKNYGEVIYTHKSKAYNYLLLATNGINTSTTDQHNGVSNFYNWGYSVDVTNNQKYSSYKLITGFTYNNTCLYIGQILCSNKSFTEFKDVNGLTDYIKNFSNDYPYIISIRCGVVTGAEGGERNNNICFCSEYEHSYNKYTLDDNFYVTSVDKYDKSIDYFNTNSTTILGCAFSHLQYHVKQTLHTNEVGSLTHIINKHFLETAYVDCSYTDYFTKEPKVYYYYDFEKNGVKPIEKMASSLGLVWCYDYNTAINTNMFTGADRCYYPIQTNGFYEGEFVKGEQSKELKQAEWGGNYDSWYDDNGVVDEPDDNIYVDDISLNKPTLSTNNTFNRTFILNKKSVNDLSNYLWNTDENVFNQLLNGLKLLGQNPLNGIIDLRLYPFDMSELSSNATNSNITVGRTDTGVQGLVLNDNNCVIELGNCKLKGWNNNFLDYEPYTQALLYIPYVGVTNIDVTTFLNKTISVKLIVDLTTGQGTAVVFSDDIPMIYHTANIGVNIAVSGDNASAYAQGVINAGLSTAQGVVATGLGVASKNIPVAVAGGVGVVGGAYSAFAQPLNIPTSGNNTPNCCNYCPQHCYLIISSPIINKPKNYGHTIGYACEIDTKIGDVKGYSVFNNIDTTGLICTDTEKTEIINLLNNGVYL